MKWKIVLLLCGISLIIGYFLGVFLPLGLGPCEMTNTPISKGDYYGNVINGFVAFGTCSAVIVALFLDEIRSLFKKVAFVIQLNSDEAIEEVENIKGTKKARRYHNSIQFFNNGNINAQNCELYVESASFISDNSTTTLTVENAPINWNLGNNIVYIPYQGKKVLPLFEIIAPQKQSTPDGKTDIIPATLKMLGLKNIEAKAGKWEIIYCLYSTNSKPQKFKYIVEWNGNWEERQTEMKDILKMKLEML
ncbi:hypothetical protein [Porphyromonas gingivalis]|uniref:hypothetical protein n=1 Tax=Porphyromonas gingivalis TaxID=837 RepID=UPI0012FDCC3C|nr:hypothetical protein [Porphyromonas gingivalis]MCE8181605.1 hypothetical protein [Porphyromonas gingivalis]